MTPWHDYFMGGVAVLIGGIAILAAALNWDACFQLPKLRRVEERWGRGRARWTCAIAGILFVAIGLIAATGFRIL